MLGGRVYNSREWNSKETREHTTAIFPPFCSGSIPSSVLELVKVRGEEIFPIKDEQKEFFYRDGRPCRSQNQN